MRACVRAWVCRVFGIYNVHTINYLLSEDSSWSTARNVENDTSYNSSGSDPVHQAAGKDADDTWVYRSSDKINTPSLTFADNTYHCGGYVLPLVSR